MAKLRKRVCALTGCDVTFTPKLSHQRYCSPAHRKAAENTRRRVAGASRVRTGAISREELLEEELRQVQRNARAARQVDVQAERLLHYLREAVQVAEVKFEPAEKTGDPAKTQHVWDLFLSDWHYGETVDFEEMDGLNEFNTEVLVDRVAHVYRSVVSFKAHRPYPVDTLYVALGGDMVSGDPGIHDEIRETNEKVAAEQAVECGQLIGGFLEKLVPHFNRIEVVGVPGNHPRMAKPHASKRVFNNFDWIAYKYAELYLKSYSSVRCFFPRSGFIVQEIAGNNVLLWHGDGIKSTMPGVPWGGVVRRTNELRKTYARRGVDLDGFKVGHFHQANVIKSDKLFMNGSLVGTNEYGLKNFGGGGDPEQLLMTWDVKKHRLTDVSFITPE